MEQIFVWKHKSHWLFKAFLHTYFYIIFSSCFLALTLFLLYFCWASQVVLVVKNLPANAGDLREAGLIPGSGRSPGGRHNNPLQCSCLENPTDRGAWRATVHRLAKSWTRLKRLGVCMYVLFVNRFVQLNQTSAKDFPWRFIHEQRNKFSNWIGIVYRLINWYIHVSVWV